MNQQRSAAVHQDAGADDIRSIRTCQIKKGSGNFFGITQSPQRHGAINALAVNFIPVINRAAQTGELTVTYPLATFVQKMKRAGTDYTINWKGNTVTSLAPNGKVWPLFEKVPFPTPAYPQ